jgi:hypothetical protein
MYFKREVEKIWDRRWRKTDESDFVSLKRDIERTIIYLKTKLEVIDERIGISQIETT